MTMQRLPVCPSEGSIDRLCAGFVAASSVSASAPPPRGDKSRSLLADSARNFGKRRPSFTSSQVYMAHADHTQIICHPNFYALYYLQRVNSTCRGTTRAGRTRTTTFIVPIPPLCSINTVRYCYSMNVNEHLDDSP